MSFSQRFQFALGKRNRDADEAVDNSDGLFVTPGPETQRTGRLQASPSMSVMSSSSGMNDDHEEDDGAHEEGYNENMEQFPTSPAYDKHLPKLKGKATVLLQQLLLQLQAHGLRSQDIKNMHVSALEAGEEGEPQKLMIALVGDTGAGKSSVLNAIIDIPGLARVVAAGGSVTCVVTLYEHKLEFQDQNFAAEVHYFRPDQIRRLLEEQLLKYNRYTFEADPQWSPDEAKEHRQQSETAVQTFRALFCDRHDFESPRAAEECLALYYQRPLEELVDTMTAWCLEHFRGLSVTEAGSTYQHFQADTVEELSDQLDPLTASSFNFEERALWPLVEKVRVGAPGSRILRYLILADLPGITDTNKLRVNATHDHIQKCQALWYVAGVIRIIDDPNLEWVFQHYAERFLGCLSVIITKIDVGIDPILANELKKRMNQSIGNYQKLEEEARGLRAMIINLKKKKRVTRTMSMAEKLELGERIEECEKKLKLATRTQLEGIIDARNNAIVGRLRRDKQKYLPTGSELPVYCVSNKHYLAHKENSGVIIEEGSRLGVVATGIPALREHALTLGADNLLVAIETYITHKVNVQIRNVRLWAENCPVKRRQGLMEIVRELGSKWSTLIRDCPGQLRQVFTDNVLNKVRNHQPASEEAALTAFNDIRRSYLPPSQLAFYRNGGNHYTRAVGAESWNELFIEFQSRQYLRPGWDKMLPAQRLIAHRAVYELIDAVRDLPGKLNKDPGAVVLPMATSQDLLNAHINGVLQALGQFETRFDEDLRNIKLDATDDVHTGHFTQAIQPAYDEGRDDRGRGVTGRCMAHLQAALNPEDDESPFAQAADLLETALDNAARTRTTTLQHDISRILNTITQQFEAVLARQGEAPAEARARVELRKWLVKALPEIDSIILGLQSLKRKYEG